MLGPFKRNPKACSLTLFVLGSILIISACVVNYKVMPDVVEDKVKDNLKLEEGSEAYKAFVSSNNSVANVSLKDFFVQLEPPVTPHMKYTLWHVENAAEVLKNGAKPKVVERGPYVYDEVMLKQNVTKVGEDSLFYNSYKAYHFNAKKSASDGCVSNVVGQPCDPKTDKVKIFNPLVGILSHLWPSLIEKLDVKYRDKVIKIVNVLFGNALRDVQEGLFIEDTVANLLFDVSLFNAT